MDSHTSRSRALRYLVRRQALRAILTGGGVVALTGAFAAAPAHGIPAAPPAAPTAECPADHMCVWEKLVSTLTPRRGSNYLYRDAFSRPQLNNFEDRKLYNVTGAFNKTRFDAKLFTGANGTGSSLCLNPGQAHARYDSQATNYWKSMIIYTDARACS